MWRLIHFLAYVLTKNVLIQILESCIKASAHSFKCFTSRLLKLFFSFRAHTTSAECHAWFHLNAARPDARKMEKVNITKNIVQSRIRTTNTARIPDYKSTVLTTRPQLAWYEIEWNVHEIYISIYINIIWIYPQFIQRRVYIVPFVGIFNSFEYFFNSFEYIIIRLMISWIKTFIKFKKNYRRVFWFIAIVHEFIEQPSLTFKLVSCHKLISLIIKIFEYILKRCSIEVDRGNANETQAVCNNRKYWFFKCHSFWQFGINWKLLNVNINMTHENYA